MLFKRMLRAALLDRRLYEELRLDPVALHQGFAVLFIGVVGVIIGTALTSVLNDRPLGASIVSGLVTMPGLWLIPATSLFFLGGLAITEKGDRGSNRDLLIAITYSAAPAFFGLFIFVPGIGPIIDLLILPWILVSMIFAAKSVLGVNPLKAAVFIAPGFLITLIILTLQGKPGDS